METSPQVYSYIRDEEYERFYSHRAFASDYNSYTRSIDSPSKVLSDNVACDDFMDQGCRFRKMTLRRIVFALSSLVITLGVLSSAYGQSDSAKLMLSTDFSGTHAENLKGVNSESNEASASISADESTLYFSSYRNGGRSTIWSAKRTANHTWGEPQIMAELEGKQSMSVLSVSADGHIAVVQACNRADGIFSSCDLYLADVGGGQVKNLRSLGSGINTEWWEGQPNISSDGQLLFFSSDRKGGEGGKDIYMSSRSVTGEWGTPIDLKFNTGSDEVSPFIASDNQTLYFASDRSGGEGGFDIYVSYRKGDNEWTEPKNLGPAVNTKANEMFFMIPPHEDAVYLTSDRDGGSGGFDLWKITPNPVKPKPQFIAFSGSVRDAVTNQLIATTPTLSIVVSASNTDITNTGSAKEYRAMAPIGKPIRITASADGYAPGNIEVQTPTTFDEAGFTQDIKLNPTKVRIIGHTSDLFTNAKISDAKVTLEQVDAAGNSVAKQVAQSDADGTFGFDAVVGGQYRIAASKAEYQGYYQPIDDIPIRREALTTVTKDIRMTPADIKPITVNFETAKFDLMPDQMSHFDDFVRRVKGNPNIKLEVQGYTDERGSEELNRVLSENRAKTVQDKLISMGVPPNQLAVVKGYGKSNPLDPSSNEEAYAKNRRVEIRIVGK